MELYNDTAFNINKLITKTYSTSFSLGILAFSKEYRPPIYGIYGFVRLADEIVDTFHDYDKKELLDSFIRETHDALDKKISTNPVLHAFQHTVHRYGIEREYIDAFLKSMAMDLYKNSYDDEEYSEYIFGSAESVGLMCLKVFVDGDQQMFDELKGYARSLGAAFQKVNFLRDIQADLGERGRIYLPGVKHAIEINEENKHALEESVEKDFQHALTGIKKLPVAVKLGVYSAYLYYYQLFDSIRSNPLAALMKKRVRVSNAKKLSLLMKSYIEVNLLKSC